MVEWLKAPVLKTGEGLRPPRVRIPIPPPYSEKALSENLAPFYMSFLLSIYLALDLLLKLVKLTFALPMIRTHKDEFITLLS